MVSVHAIGVWVCLIRSGGRRVDVSHHGGPVASGKHRGRGQSLLQLLFLFSVLGPPVLKPYLKHRHCPMQKHVILSPSSCTYIYPCPRLALSHPLFKSLQTHFITVHCIGIHVPIILYIRAIHGGVCRII